jgi:acetyl esterase/lipase
VAHKNIEYATTGERRLLVDVYLPSGKVRPPLVVWVHGGAWRSGDKENPPQALVAAGFALASVDYRLSGEAKFPAQVHDIKAAIRFLRSKGNEFGYSTDRIAIAGDSAGGHLAVLVGVSSGVKPLEGTIGEHLDQSSAVQAIVDYFGPTNFVTILKQSTPHGLSVREPALKLLLGDMPEKLPQPAKLASPVSHVDENDPPLLIFHGDQDPQVPINQSHEMEGAYERQNLPVEFVVVHGAAHGGEAFFNEANFKRATSFLNQNLAPQ